MSLNIRRQHTQDLNNMPKFWTTIKPLFNFKVDKTTGYHRHILRPPIFVMKAFEKLKTFFLSKKHSFFIIV